MFIDFNKEKKPLAPQERNMYSVAHQWAKDLKGFFGAINISCLTALANSNPLKPLNEQANYTLWATAAALWRRRNLP